MHRTRAAALGFAVTGGGVLHAADTDDGSTIAGAAASRPTEELVEKFSAFAGSTQNAQALVDGLRNGTPITLTDSGGSSTVVRSMRAEQIGKAEKSEKSDAAEKPSKPERIEVGRMDKAERPERPARPARPERPERTGK